MSPTQIANISGYLQENPGSALNENIIPFLAKLLTPSVSDKANKLFRHLAKREPVPGRWINPGVRDIQWGLEITRKGKEAADALRKMTEAQIDHLWSVLSLLSAAWAQDQAEVHYFIFDHLLPLNLLKLGPVEDTIIITPKGWETLQTQPELAGRQCFVAMSFNPELHPIFLGPISEGIRQAGYEPFRTDHKEHNEDITDEIIAGIRRAKFVLADFTFERTAVYYEAGFAAGLGKPVIRTIREDHKNTLNFDTRQLNHIHWRADDLPVFARAIANRIVATLGQGPVPV